MKDKQGRKNQQNDAGEVPLTLQMRERGKKFYYLYALFNAFSYATLAEAVMILMLLRLGATPVWVGAVSSMVYGALPFMLVGYWIIPKLGVSRTAGIFWALRSGCAGFMIASPWAAANYGGSAGLWFMFMGALGFFVARAAGMASFTGIITELTTGRDKGELIGNSFKLFQGGGFFMTLMIAIFLGGEAPLSRYQIFLSVGLVTGLAAAAALWNIPESGTFRKTRSFNFKVEWNWLTGTGERRWFFAMMVIIPVTQGITRMFVILVAKQGYGLSDQDTMIFILVGTLGGLFASYTYGFFLDKLGSRPMLIINNLLDGASMVLVVLLPASLSLPLVGLLFFSNGYSHVAFQSSIQHYFLCITDRKNQLSQAIITQVVGGIAGGLAIYLAGYALEGIGQALPAGQDPLLSFRWFYGGLLGLFLIRSAVLHQIPALQSQGIRDSLNALFSPWDWRAIHAVKRAVSRQSEDQETKALDYIMRAHGGGLFREDLEGYLKSPSFAVRERAMEALVMVKPSMNLIEILLKDLRENQFTTAPAAALWLGRWQVKRAIPELRKEIDGKDINLRGRAIHALVELGDQDSLPLITKRFVKSPNPLVIIEGARALSLWGGSGCYRILLEKFRQDIPLQARDELSLSIVRVAGIYDFYYQDIGLLRREPDRFFSEWRARYKGEDSRKMVAVFVADEITGEMLKVYLGKKRGRFENWFSEPTLAWLEEFSGPITLEAAHLFLQLLLAKKGLHLTGV